MSTKHGEGEEREEMLFKLTRSTLRILNLSLRVSTKLFGRGREEELVLPFLFTRCKNEQWQRGSEWERMPDREDMVFSLGMKE